VLYDRQPQPRSPKFPGSSLVHAIKPLKEPVMVFWCDTNTSVGDVDDRKRSLISDGDVYLAA
jgi:hypothetical protein